MPASQVGRVHARDAIVDVPLEMREGDEIVIVRAVGRRIGPQAGHDHVERL
ncbi:MAG: hypothetical protein JNK64_27540 [Myxococcales bacterium]|nr:hypothetical protein [Myxococcales bacterium]